MNTNKELVYEIIQTAFDVSKEAITNVDRTPGGETNVSYFATVEGKKICRSLTRNRNRSIG